MMRIHLVAVVILMSLYACKNKKTLSGDKHVETEQFFEAYDDLKLPFSVVDTSMNVADTNTISYPIFTQFVPDTIFNNPFGKDRKVTIHPVGKIEQSGKETYFVTQVTGKNKSAIYLMVNDKNKFTASMPLLISNNDDVIHTASIDKKLTVIVNKEWTVKNDIYYDRTIYAYNNVGVFTTVLTETNEERSIAEETITNPFDTFPKRYAYSGDYAKNSKNVLFIRDGNVPGEYRFYVRFTNGSEDDPCGGEIKGIFKMISEKAGVFTGNGDPCVLDLSFSTNEVKVKETGSCGNYRGIKCFFNDTYTRKKEKIPAKKK